MRTAFDFTPLYRSTIGFDRLADMLNSAQRLEQIGNFPPYNVERTDEDHYRITMAVAGFSADELDLTFEPNKLTITGQKKENEGQEDGRYLYRGIAARSFRQVFNLADHVKVVGADLRNGMLVVDLAREVPEALKPRRIEVRGGSGSNGRTIEHNASENAQQGGKAEQGQKQAA